MPDAPDTATPARSARPDSGTGASTGASTRESTEPGIGGPPPPPLPPPSLTAAFFLERPDDNVALHVALYDLVLLERPDGWRVGSKADRAGSVVLTTDPQHLVEYADKATSEAPSQFRPIYGPPSVLSFRVPPGTPSFPLSVAGVLAAVRDLELRTSTGAGTVSVPTASLSAARDRAADGVEPAGGAVGVARVRRRRAAGRAIDPQRAVVLQAPSPNGDRPAADAGTDALPEPGAEPLVVVPDVKADPSPGDDPPPPPPLPRTSVCVPARLQLGPPGGATRFRHAATPVEHDAQVELWHSRFSVVADDGTVIEPATPTVVVAAVSSVSGSSDAGWNSVVDEGKINNALTESMAHLITQRAKFPTSIPTAHSRPLDMDHLVLSPFGASVRLTGEWPGQSQSPKGYRHAVVLGRDDEVRIDVDGRLYPFGHRARLTTTTRRLPRSNRDTTPVVLKTQAVLHVRQRVVEYAGADAVGRAFPWQRIEIVNRTSPPGDAVEHQRTVAGTTHTCLTLEVDDEPFRFECVGVDRADHVTTFALPLLFVPDGVPTDSAHVLWSQRGPTFRTVELAGQALGVAPALDGAGAGPPSGADVGAAGPADATTVLARAVTLSGALDGPDGYRPRVTTFSGVSPALGALSGQRTEQTFSYAFAYLASGFSATPPAAGLPSNAGELLLTVDRTLTNATRDAVGLVSVPQLPVQGVSRLVGAVAAAGDTPQQVATNLATAAAGTFDPAAYFGDLPATLLGIFPIKDLLELPREGQDALTLAQDAPRQLVETLDGVRRTTVTWGTTLVPTGGKYPPDGSGFVTLRADDGPIELDIEQRTFVGLDGAISSRSTTTVSGATLALGAAGEELIRLPIRSVFFESSDGAAPTVDVDLGKVDFRGPLAFVSALADLIAQSGLAGARTRPGAGTVARGAPASGPYVDVDGEKVSAGLALPVPDLAIGMFSIQDLAFRSQLNLYFTKEPELVFDFATPENPFHATVSAIGGGGWVRIALTTAGIVEIAGGLQFGAAVAIDIGIASGRASVMAGVDFTFTQQSGLALTGYLRAEGHVEVLKVYSMSLVMEIYLAYEGDRLFGGAEVSFSIKLLFFSKTVRTHVEREFTGSNADPTFAELMAPADWPRDEQLPWDAYCTAFAAP